jgi:hypothetical protein
MGTIFGVDLKGLFAGVFAGQISKATFTRRTAGAYDEDDPSGTPAQAVSSYSCDAQASSFEERFVEEAAVHKATYQAALILGTIVCVSGTAIAGIVPRPGDTISIPPPSGGAPQNGAIVAILAVTPATVTVAIKGPGP